MMMRVRAVTVLLALAGATPAWATTPTPPASLVGPKEEIKGSLANAKGSLDFKISIRVNEPVKGLKLSASLVPDVNPLLQKVQPVRLLEKRVTATRDKASEETIPIKIPGPGRYELDIRLSGTTEKGEGFSDRLVRHVVVDKQGAYRVVAANVTADEEQRYRLAQFKEQIQRDPKHPDIRLLRSATAPVSAATVKKIASWLVAPERRLTARPSGPTGLPAKYMVESAEKVSRAPDPITVKGRIVFSDPDGNVLPIVNASVNLWDDDTFGDEHLGTTVTDWNGNWSFVVDDDDGWLQDGRDLYYTFKLENTALRTRPCDSGDAYEWQSAVHDDLSDGTVLNFGTETGVQNPNSMQIWSVLNLAWNHGTTAGGQDPGLIDSCFPDDGGTFVSGTVVHILGSDNDGPDSITHEYGHAIMAKAYAAAGGNPSPGGSHGFGDCGQNKSLSWSEGWATGFMLSARPDGTYNWHEHQPGRAIEAFSSSCRVGETSEGWVAAAIGDVLDAHNDDNGGSQDRGRDKHSDGNATSPIALSSLLRDTLWGSHHDDFLAFWYSLAGELDSTKSGQAGEIMYYNWMSVIEPGSCVATKVATRTLADRNPVLRGVRQFRDLALRREPEGRALINIYYRNSPEIALLLLKDEKAQAQALYVLQFFSSLGDAAASHKKFAGLAVRPGPLIPTDVENSINAVLDVLDRRGSPELKKDVGTTRGIFGSVRGKNFEDVDRVVAEMRAKAKNAKPIALQQMALTPASQRALTQPELKKITGAGLPSR